MFLTIAEIKRANKAIGHHWFDDATFAFFNTRIESGVFAGHYFVTSEQFDSHSRRMFTVRYAHDDGRVSTVATFQEFASKGEAIAAIKRMIGE